MPVQSGRNYHDEVPASLWCPICMEVPESKVLQCKSGHVLCSKCHDIYAACPTCQQPLDKKTPIRCLHFEKMLDDLKFPCSFKSNGCNQSFTRTLLPNHEKICCFDFKKFGKFVNICKILGYSKCEFQLNNGNSKEALEHFRTHHKFNSIKGGDPFQIEFDGFKNFKNKSLWTPTIVELETCSVLILPFLNKEDIGWYAIALPNSFEKISPIEIDYSWRNASTKFTFAQIANTLEKTCKELQKPNFEGFSLPVQFLKQFNAKNHLKITCHVKENQEMKGEGANKKVVCKPMTDLLLKKDDIHEPSGSWNLFGWNLWEVCGFLLLIVCTLAFVISNGKNEMIKENAIPSPFDNWNELNLQTFEEKDLFVDQMEVFLATNRNSTLPFLQKLFEQEKPKGIGDLIMKYLKVTSIAIAVKYGTMDALDYVIKNNIHLEPDHRHNWIYWTLADRDHTLGVEKAKALVNAGVSTKFVGNEGKNLLHSAVDESNEEILEFLLRDVGMDVNETDFSGKTPLHYSVVMKDEDWAVRSSTLLLKYGANPLAKDVSGRTPVYIASILKKDRVKVYEVFREFDKV